ncbi:hypothetical protein AKJ16_DCAP09184 [Drosera capensis]
MTTLKRDSRGSQLHFHPFLSNFPQSKKKKQGRGPSLLVHLFSSVSHLKENTPKTTEAQKKSGNEHSFQRPHNLQSLSLPSQAKETKPRSDFVESDRFETHLGVEFVVQFDSLLCGLA